MGLCKNDADAAREREESKSWHVARAFWPVIVHQGGIVWGGQEYVRALNTDYMIAAFECKRIDGDSIKLVGTRYSNRNRYHRGLEAWPVGDDRRPPDPSPTRPAIVIGGIRSVNLKRAASLPEVRELLLALRAAVSWKAHGRLSIRDPDDAVNNREKLADLELVITRATAALMPFEALELVPDYDPKAPLVPDWGALTREGE